MRSKPHVWLALAVSFACAPNPIQGQSAPAATTEVVPYAIGAGLSGYNPDYEQGHLLGGTLWIDYFLTGRAPSILRGVGLEVEARDLNYGRSSTEPANLREDVVQGGLIYSWPHFGGFRPYAKFSEGYGNTDYESSALSRHHDSRTIMSGGGGFEFLVLRNLWLRADYEYQSWPDFFKHPATPEEPARPAERLNPQGFTVGAVVHFERLFHRERR